MNKLTATGIKSKKMKLGKHSDGGGLYLKVSASGSKSWVFRFAGGTGISKQTGKEYKKQVEMGLGSYPDKSLADARDDAAVHRKTVAAGKSPILKRDTDIQAAKQTQIWTFDKCAEAYIEAFSPSWKNKKHKQQWKNTLKTYASPVIGHLSVADIDIPEVLRIIQPIWQTKTETASRVRGRIERVLSWSIVMKYRGLPNPAVWRGNLDQVLEKPQTVTPTVHHPALPYSEMGVFMQAVQKHDSIAAKALEFCILTGVRTENIIAASWDEFDIDARVWTISAERMKSPRPHSVPLSDQAIELLEGLNRNGGWLFPSNQHGKHISENKMMDFIKDDLQWPNVTVHGFRSTFKDWAIEKTDHQDMASEMALSHKDGDTTRAAYARGDLFDKRIPLMQDWADYAVTKPANVTTLRKHGQSNTH